MSNNNRTIEIIIDRIDETGRRKPFREIIEDLRSKMEDQLEKRGFSSNNIILFSAKDIALKGKVPIRLTYKVVEKSVARSEEEK